MSEKSRVPSRFLWLITISMVLLTFSLFFIVQFSDNSVVSESVFEVILVNNNSSQYLEPTIRSGNTKPSLILSVALPKNVNPPVKIQDSSQSSDPTKKSVAFGVEREQEHICDTNHALLQVYMYDLPPEFHFGLLGWKGKADQTWPDVRNMGQIPPYPGGLNLQHSIEYWLTLDLLLSNYPNPARPCSAIRVYNSSQADIIFVPFFSSLSYNRYSKLHGKEKISVNRMLQSKIVEFLKSRDEWKKRGGKDHVIVAHHPNSMLVARKKLGSAMFILADFGRYPVEIANIKKDVIAPHH